VVIRIQSDNTLPPEKRRKYSSVPNAFKRIFQEEGIFALFEGAIPTACKGMALNLGMFAFYEKSKEVLTEIIPQNGVTISFISSLVGGTAAALASLPFDNAKTKL
jgi:hypothetical protein